MKIAILSDIHGNSWALTRILKDIEKRKPDIIVNLGDSLYGPLNPKETFHLLESNKIVSISGNQDRFIIENIDKPQDYPTLKFVMNELNDEIFNWLNSLPKTQILDAGIFMCHGTPQSDNTYLLENVDNSFHTVNEISKIEEFLPGVEQKIIFCGHSHTPRLVQTPLWNIINPGSVGLPAYDDDLPVYHKIQNFNNHAQYCLFDLIDNEIFVEQISIPYDFNKAVASAIKNNRPDWAGWLKTGRA